MIWKKMRALWRGLMNLAFFAILYGVFGPFATFLKTIGLL